MAASYDEELDSKRPEIPNRGRRYVWATDCNAEGFGRFRSQKRILRIKMHAKANSAAQTSRSPSPRGLKRAVHINGSHPSANE